MSTCSVTQNLHYARVTSKQILILIALVAILVVSVLLWLGPKQASEPVYQGMPLSHWTTNLFPVGSTNGAVVPESREAVRNIGTNAIPFLLQWIQYSPADSDKVAIDVNDRHMVRAYGSAHAFEALGSQGNAAVPILARLANSRAPQNNRYLYVQALAGIGPAGLPALLTVVTNPSNNARVFAISAIENLGTNAAHAMPTLLNVLRDRDQEVVSFAASALGNLRLQPHLAVPALQELLQGESTTPCRFAINALGQFGPEARKAVTDLTRFLNDPDQHMRDSAIYALRKIAPEVITNAPSQ